MAERLLTIDGEPVRVFTEEIPEEHGIVITTQVGPYEHRHFYGWGKERWVQIVDDGGKPVFTKDGKPVLKLQVPTQDEIDRCYRKGREFFNNMDHAKIKECVRLAKKDKKFSPIK